MPVQSGIASLIGWERWRLAFLNEGLILLILILAIFLRFTGHNWDQGSMLHPDERYLVDLMTKLRFASGIRGEEKETTHLQSQQCLQQYRSTGLIAEECTILSFTTNHRQAEPLRFNEQATHCIEAYPHTAGAGHFFDTRCSPLNPHNAGSTNFAYGPLPLFLTRALAATADSSLHLLGLNESDPYTGGFLWHDEIASAGRFLSSSLDVLSIFFIYRIGLQLHGKRAGLLAAAFYAFSPLAIQLSHFATVNAAANFFCILALWFAHRVYRDGNWLASMGFGFATAAAMASRINLAPLLGIIAIAFLVRLYRKLRQDTKGGDNKVNVYLPDLVGFLVCCLSTLFFFRIFNPYAFIGPGLISGLNERWLLDIQNSITMANGHLDWPPNWQWAGRLSYFYPLKDILLWGLGLSAGIPALLGIVYFTHRWLCGHAASSKYLLLLAWVLGYFGWVGGAWVMTMRYFLPIYGALSLIAACFLSAMFEKYRLSEGQKKHKLIGTLLAYLLMGLPLISLVWAMMFHHIYRQPLTRIQGSAWIHHHIPSDMSIRMRERSLDAPLINIALANHPSADVPGDQLLLQRSSFLIDGFAAEETFHVHQGGIIQDLFFPHLGRRTAGTGDLHLEVKIWDERGNTLIQLTLSDPFLTARHPLGTAYTIPVEEEVELKSGENYHIRLLVREGDLYIGGSVVSDEGTWDDRLSAVRSCQPDVTATTDACVYRAPYLDRVLQYNMNMAAEDDAEKLENLINGLSRSDYLTISSNRFYDSQARNSVRFPLSNHFYHLLFQGQLGFDLVAKFAEGFQLGNLRILDQRLPHHPHPTWLNQWEADEAFHVYDHPAVFIFQKKPDFDVGQVQAELRRVSLAHIHSSPIYGDCPFLDPNHNLATQCTANVANFHSPSSREVGDVPSQLLYSLEQLEIQSTESSWLDQFSYSRMINQYSVLAVVAWLITITAIGFTAWIPLFFAFPNFADRGFGFAKVAGLVFLSWLAWLLTSAQLPFWNQSGLWSLLLIAMAASFALFWNQRERFTKHFKQNWKRMASIELLFLSLFLLFLLIRLSNPDLWHPIFGGEKMMDSAYLNGVLRSEIFPPLNPWYSGSYINYYYFGFVFVGVPSLLSGIIPSIAYNLIIPTLFAITGVAAFSLSYNVAARIKNLTIRAEWAGLATLALMLLLGNLETLRLWIQAIHEIGASVLQDGNANLLVTTFAGFEDWLKGTPLPIAGHEWMWNPTRVISHSIQDHSITEFPFFTFLYGDLHAHMMALPILLLSLAFVVYELLSIEQDHRKPLLRWSVRCAWAVTTGLTWATNSWDWIPITLISSATLLYAWWERRRVASEQHPDTHSHALRALSIFSNRKAVIELLAILISFLAVNLLATAPFRAWFATTATAIEIWRGPFTPVDAYLSIHGHFLFLLVCLLLCLSYRHRNAFHLSFNSLSKGAKTLLLSIGVGLLLVTLYFAAQGREILLILVPLIVWGVYSSFSEKSNSYRIVYWMFLVALGLTLIPEFIRIRQDIGRQNTVFKLYFMSWQYFSLFGGIAFATIWNSRKQWTRWFRYAWYTAAMALFIIAASYPYLATVARSKIRFEASTPISLDGLEFMRHAQHWEGNDQYPLEPDHQIIQWLQNNVSGAPTIMEGRNYGSEYKWNGRIASFTGLPSVIGWQYHQQQQRTFPPMSELIQRRAANVTAFYTTPEILDALRILQAYDVQYIILGPLEQALYDRNDESDPAQFVDGLTKFDEMVEQGLLEVVFEHPYSYLRDDQQKSALARIFRVRDG